MFQGGLSTYLDTITNSLCLCDGQLVEDDEQFGVSSSKGKKSSVQDTAPTRVRVHLLARVRFTIFIYIFIRVI